MKIHIALLVILIFALTCSAADISGKWLAQITGPTGSKSERIFTFQVSGDKLTGTVTNLQVSLATFEEKGKPPMTGTLKTQNADPQAISEGKISGDDVSFAIVTQTPFGDMRADYKGKISGDTIKFTIEQSGGMGGPMGGGQPQEIVAKRVAP
jgi:hypothetical protein